MVGQVQYMGPDGEQWRIYLCGHHHVHFEYRFGCMQAEGLVEDFPVGPEGLTKDDVVAIRDVMERGVAPSVRRLHAEEYPTEEEDAA
jgi:hypothetical protein